MKKYYLVYICVYMIFADCCLAQVALYSGLPVRYQRCNGCNQTQDSDANGSFVYDPITNYQPEDVSSDYDMRDAGHNATIWHRGIDYSRPSEDNTCGGFFLPINKQITIFFYKKNKPACNL